MAALFKAWLLIGFVLAAGPPLFWAAVWRPAASGEGEDVDAIARRLRRLAVAGGLVYGAASVGDAARAALAVAGWEDLFRFFSATTLGRVALGRAAVAALYTAWLTRPSTWDGRTGGTVLRTIGAALGALLLAVGVSLSSHAAASTAGPFPLVMDAVHVLAAGLW
ncbi:MAG TPA: hypothetical protein VF234_06680, partial [Limnochordia bacterium]